VYSEYEFPYIVNEERPAHLAGLLLCAEARWEYATFRELDLTRNHDDAKDDEYTIPKKSIRAKI
jgi:hypothetical protein